MEPGVQVRVREAVAALEAAGAIVEEVSLPHTDYGLATYYIVAPAEASANLARYDGIRFGPRLGDGDVLANYLATRGQGFGPEVKRRIMLGTYALSSGYYDAYYATAQKVRTKISEDFRTAFAKFDFVVTPTSPWTAFELGAKTDDPLAMYLNDFCTVPMPLAGIPAISIPSGLSQGLPVGFQLAGPAFSENALLDASFALERAIGFDGSPARRSGGDR
jgi:aspartyl-tRNA(Asn)/glutamyl-tRNA(Gln) amidotransferase subunit A